MLNLFREKHAFRQKGQGLFVMIDYSKHKASNQAVLPYIVKHVSAATRERFLECGRFLQMAATRDLTKKKLHRGNFCGHRFCPMCSWRKAKKDASKIAVTMQHIKIEHGKEFLFLTLTAPNVKGDKLRDEITNFNAAFSRLVKRKDIAPIIKGYVRKLEVTYNEERNDFHPHFHCVLAVNKSYFKDRTYLSRDQWLALWREAMRDDSITQVDIRRMKENGGKELFEVATYSAKHADLEHSQEVFDVFYKALSGRQILTYNGLFKEAVKLYKNGDLDHLKPIDDTPYEIMLLYNWGFGNYVETERRELTEEERRDLRHELEQEGDSDDE